MPGSRPPLPYENLVVFPKTCRTGEKRASTEIRVRIRPVMFAPGERAPIVECLVAITGHIFPLLAPAYDKSRLSEVVLSDIALCQLRCVLSIRVEWSGAASSITLS
jgi:hypothetical protein